MTFSIPPTVTWRDGQLRLLDQRVLPGRARYLTCGSVQEVVTAIQTLAVRGAPALGATGAYGVALAAQTVASPEAVRAAASRIAEARPTAVNLRRGVERALRAYETGGAPAALQAARGWAEEDVAINRALAAVGEPLVPDGARILTHCNAGALACVGYGTALGIIRAAAEAGKHPKVWVGETRPLLQGARLTAWELDRLGIEHTLIVDAMAGALMAADDVDLVVVGADRVAANGDVANKVGTYSLAVLANHHGIPMIVAAPTSSIDIELEDGSRIPIEERPADEVTCLAGARTAPSDTPALNRAFDVTPARLISAIVTECGVSRPPFRTLASLVARGNSRPAPGDG